jgi:hypothetical protein
VLALAASLIVGLVAGAPNEAQARKKRVVILPFSGPGGGKARRGLIAGIKRRVRLVPLKRYRRAGGSGDPDSIAQACSKARCDAVVKGSVKKRRRRYSITVSVFNGGDGTRIGSRAAKVRGRRRITRAGRAIGRRCVRLVRKGRFKRRPRPKPEPVAAAPEPAPEPAPTPTAKSDTSDIPVYKASTRGREEDDEDEDDEDAGVRKRSKGGTRGTASIFDVSVGMGLAFRTLVLDAVDATDTTPPNKYDGGMYPEITAQVEVYPLVPFMKGFATGFGVSAAFSHHLSISTKPRNNADQEVDTTSWHLLLDARYRWIITDSETSPVVSLLGGFGMRNFNLSQNTVLTSFNYKFIHVGLEGKVPIMTKLIAVTAGFDIRPLMGVGQEAVNAFGSRDGGFAWSVRGGVAGRHDLGIFYFLNFEYLTHSIAFKGLEFDGQSKRNGYPDRLKPTSGSDRFIRIWVGGGYAY